MDLATMPPRRRRRFEWLRFKIKHIGDVAQVVQPVNGTDTVFTALGAERCRFTYMDDYWRLDQTLLDVGNGGYRLEMVEVHCLDHLLHWNRPGTEQMREYHRGVDDFVRRLHAKCRDNGIAFALLSDHGMEPVSEVIDLRAELKALGVPDGEYDLFLENTKATLWFHADRARSKITAALGSTPSGVLLGWQDMARYDLHFTDNSYGDAYFCARPGVSFFPNDFHQPVASAVLALTDRQQRQRLRVPWHQADHGYLPDCDCEIGFMVVPDDGIGPVADWMSLIDFAPSVLRLLGEQPAFSMRGGAMFVSAEGRRAS